MPGHSPGRLLPIGALLLLVLPAAAQELTVTGGLGETRAWAGNEVGFWLRVRNDSAQTWQAVTVTAVTADIAITRTCAGVPLDRCDAVLTDPLAPGDERVVRGTLVAGTPGDYRPTLLASASAGTAATKQSVVALGTLTVDRYGWSWLVAAGRVIEGLWLPVALAFLGYVYQRRLQVAQEADRTAAAHSERARLAQDAEIERGRKQQERELEQVRLERESERTHVRQTLTVMLPILHECATRHYAPMETAARALIEDMQAFQPAWTDDDYRGTVYRTVRIYQHIRQLTRSKGAFYFKDRIGEEIAAAAIEAFHDVLFVKNSPEERAVSRVLDAVDGHPHLSVGAFTTLAADTSADTAPLRTALDILAPHLRMWLGSVHRETGLRYLQAFRAVLSYETNRPYAYWYQDEVVLGADGTITGTIAGLERLAVTGGKTELKGKFLEYLQRTQRPSSGE